MYFSTFSGLVSSVIKSNNNLLPFRTNYSISNLFNVDASLFKTVVRSGNTINGGVGECIATITISNAYSISQLRGNYVISCQCGNPYTSYNHPNGNSGDSANHLVDTDWGSSILLYISTGTSFDISPYVTFKFPDNVYVNVTKFTYGMWYTSSAPASTPSISLIVDAYNGTTWEKNICNSLSFNIGNGSTSIMTSLNLIYNTSSGTIPTTTKFNQIRFRFTNTYPAAILYIGTCHVTGDWYK